MGEYISLLRKTQAALAGVLIAVLMVAAPASAGHSVYLGLKAAFYQGSAQFYFHYEYAGNNMYSIRNMEVKRWKYNAASHVCDSKAKTKITLPSGYNYTDYSPYRSGCTFYIRVENMSQTTGNYPSGSTYRSYWKDTDTGGSYKYIKGVTITRS